MDYYLLKIRELAGKTCTLSYYMKIIADNFTRSTFSSQRLFLILKYTALPCIEKYCKVTPVKLWNPFKVLLELTRISLFFSK
jgi:hypothetical protein